MSKTIAVDFDGVLHRYSRGWQDGKIYDRPVEGAVEAYYSLMDKGYHLVVFTTRTDLDAVRKWMHRHFDFEKRVGHMWEPEITNVKPLAIAYIDDRGIRFTSWKDMLNYF